ncbi:MAG: GTP-binding protein [Rubritalea sp.]|jgi:sulfate adenylyltransferase subunit 1|tara:strand:- start:824 stop:2098 length:1275 start_codon:yes stop_codon:yes gene_type:complete
MSDTTGYLDMDLLRLTTAGSVDDGKSTLIGRLLYDSKNTFDDQMEAVERSSAKRGDENINLALLTDGLKAEREQGITIDVAYRYFATPKRKFIVSDTPGHIQYTRNMVTGASTANLAIILVDARLGVIEQTMRHAFIASLLRIQHIVICVNKMDLVDFSEEAFKKVVSDFKQFASRLENVVDVSFIPISALKGDNVVDASENMDWYKGTTLLYHLETVYVGNQENHVEARFPVQWVIRPQSDEFHDFRGFAGRVAGGVFKPGDEIIVHPSGFTTKIKKIYSADKELDQAFSPLSVTMTTEDEIDISRGNLISKTNNLPKVNQNIEAMVCWFSESCKLVNRAKYIIRHTSNEARVVVTEVKYKVNVNTLHKVEDDKDFKLNDIGKITLRTSAPLIYDSYRKNRATGSFILIDPQTNETIAAGMIV